MHFRDQNQRKSVVIAGHKTSISLECDFWVELEAIAEQKNISLSQLITQIDAQREGSNLASSLRLFVLRSLKS